MTTTVETQPVRFASAGDTLVGTVDLPANHRRPLPVVVVTGTWTSVKEQMTDRYATALAERGFAALSFDFAGFGDSEGDLRDVESPGHKIVDVHAAVGHLADHPDVDAERLAEQPPRASTRSSSVISCWATAATVDRTTDQPLDNAATHSRSAATPEQVGAFVVDTITGALLLAQRSKAHDVPRAFMPDTPRHAGRCSEGQGARSAVA